MRIPSGKIDQKIFFVAVDSTDRVTRKTGLSSFTVYRSRNGGTATVYTTPTIAELDSTNMPGVYCLTIDEDTTVASTSDSEEYCVHITQASMAPVTRTIELYRRVATTGNSLAVDSAGGVTLADAVAHGGTLGSSTATLALSRINVTSQTSNSSAITATGNGTGHGITAASGSGATGNGINATANSTNGTGLAAAGAGNGHGIRGTGGATGVGVRGDGGATSGAGIGGFGTNGGAGIAGTGQGSGPGLHAVAGATGAGFKVVGGSSSGNGVEVTTTSGDGFNIQPTAGHGFLATANGSSKHGMVLTGGTGGTSDGFNAAAGTGGVDMRANVTGNRTGNISGTIGNLASGAKADVNAELVDCLSVDTYAEPGQETPAATNTLAKKISYLFKMMRNKATNDGTTMKLYNDGGSTVDQKATVSESGGTVTRGEIATGP